MPAPPHPLGARVSIAAPPGTGKSTVLPHLTRRAHGHAVVADIDEVLEDGSLLGVLIADQSAAPIWPAYDRLWDRIAGLVTRAGIDVVLLTQVPSHPPSPDAGTVVGWEIDDEVRGARLRERGEPTAIIADALSDARMLRRELPPSRIVRTGPDESPERCADLLWEAVRPHLSTP